MASSFVTTASCTSSQTTAASTPTFQDVGPLGKGPMVGHPSSMSSSHEDSSTATTSPSSTVDQQHQQQKHTKRMICGGIAGMVAKTATNPLERIKMLSQTGETGLVGGGERSIMAIYRQIIHKEGILGLWAGNGANLLRIFPSKAVVFSSHDFYKSLFRQYCVDETSSSITTAGAPTSASLPAYYSFLAGGLAGMTATAVTYPLDLARGRISGKMASLDGTTKTKAYTGIAQTIFTTLHDEGIRGLYRGVTPTLLGAMPYVGIQFGTVGLLERLFPLPSPTASHQGDADDTGTTPSSSPTSTPLRKMMFGGLGGVTAGLLTYPNDTVRRLLQLQGSRGTQTLYTGYWDCVRQTYQAQGIGRLYRGMTVNLIRMAPNTAVQFGTYELLKQWTGAK